MWAPWARKGLSLDSHETGFFKLCGKTIQDLDKKPLADRPLPGSCIYYSSGKGWKAPPPKFLPVLILHFLLPKRKLKGRRGFSSKGFGHIPVAWLEKKG